MIDGTGSPKFIGSDNHEVLLDFVVVLTDEPDYQVLEFNAEIDCKRYYFGRGYHWNYRIQVNLYKYWTKYHVPVKTKYDEIMKYLFDTVELSRHRDAPSFSSSFFIYSIIPIYIERKDFRDGLIIDFRSCDLVDHTKTTESGIPEDDIDQLPADDTGALPIA
jgi:hypothetical protein